MITSKIVFPFHLFLLGTLLIMFFGCDNRRTKAEWKPALVANTSSTDFAAYWFTGEAELNTYDIRQSRYGEERKGEAIMVFVTEDFSKSKQVKLDNPKNTEKDKIPVMKLNHIRRFTTGIYDYSMMQSVFTPIDLKNNSRTLKTTTTSQDWCGHTFTQLNLDGEKYRLNGMSYFESEGDKLSKLPASLLEDELLTRLRISPESIPTGKVKVIPSTFFSRLWHKELEPQVATIAFENNGETTYLILKYLDIDRSFKIGFEKNFPHKIIEWEERLSGGLVSAGKLKATMKSAYWRQHDNKHEYLRDSLLLR